VVRDAAGRRLKEPFIMRRFAFTIASFIALSSAFAAAYPGAFSLSSLVELMPHHHGRSGYIVASS
jgi:hypothetical protein